MVNKCLYGTNHIKLKDGRNEHKFTFLCEINSKDENDIREKLKLIKDFHQLIYKTKDISNALDEIDELLKSEREISIKMPKLINNYLGEIRSYQDRTGHFLNKKFPQSEKVFIEAKSYEYDNKFCYRYLDQLRNYMQHCGDTPYSSIKSYYDNGKPVTKLYMKNKIFIEQYTAMKSKLKRELSLDLEKNIDIIEQLRLMYRCILDIHTKVINSSINSELYSTMIYINTYKNNILNMMIF